MSCVNRLGLDGEKVTVAAVCVYPNRVRDAAQALKGSGVPIASVATGFPAGQTPLAQRIGEIEQAIEMVAAGRPSARSAGRSQSGSPGRTIERAHAGPPGDRADRLAFDLPRQPDRHHHALEPYRVFCMRWPSHWTAMVHQPRAKIQPAATPIRATPMIPWVPRPCTQALLPGRPAATYR